MLAELQALVSKSIDANVRMVQNGSHLVRQAAAGEVNVSRLADHGRSVLRQAFTDFVRLSTNHTAQLIDLGVAVSDSLVGARQARGASTSSPKPLFDLKLSGTPGSLCQTAFAIESDRSEAVSTGFKCSLLVDSAGEEAIDAAIEFQPEVLELLPNERRRVIVRYAIPEDLRPGTYHTLVTPEAMPQMSFRLLVEVEPASKAEAEPPSTEAAASKKPRVAKTPRPRAPATKSKSKASKAKAKKK